MNQFLQSPAKILCFLTFALMSDSWRTGNEYESFQTRGNGIEEAVHFQDTRQCHMVPHPSFTGNVQRLPLGLMILQ